MELPEKAFIDFIENLSKVFQESLDNRTDEEKYDFAMAIYNLDHPSNSGFANMNGFKIEKYDEETIKSILSNLKKKGVIEE